jgi:hypothetical protein
MATIIILNQDTNIEAYYRITNDIDYTRKRGTIFHKLSWIMMVASIPGDVEILAGIPGSMFEIVSVTESTSFTNTTYYSVVEFKIEEADNS